MKKKASDNLLATFKPQKTIKAKKKLSFDNHFQNLDSDSLIAEVKPAK